ncbi:hypothetical protein [Tichowtungia aerotolerans]|uniref:Uncharacterized protein n=1 Tax=Tichowtungia aerotolerans TaxID=2697043 RepID=A0A6P1M3T5_9BACT|nr:hypothetical protein [Tichowtungia aerotolerans]QHI69509.1 hypothetical protein GT409_08590 [Tichowtungia aerotolerans]
MKKIIYLLGVVLQWGALGFSDDTVSLNVTSGHAEISIPSIKDWQYTIECSEDLRNWTPVEKEIFGAGAEIVCTNRVERLSCQFYRAMRSSEFTVSFENTIFQIGNQWLYDVYENCRRQCQQLSGTGAGRPNFVQKRL